MNALTGHHVDEDMSSAAPPAPPSSAPCQHTLRRTGRKAVRFTGWQIVEARGTENATQAHCGGAMHYDLAIFRTVANAMIVELTARRLQLDEQDTHLVEVFANLQDAASWLENYDCANDVPISAALAAGTGPMALSVLQAVQLRQLIARIRDDYRGLLSDVFEALDITESEAATPDRPSQGNAQDAH